MTTCPSCASTALTSIPGAGARAAYLCVTCTRRFVDGDDSPGDAPTTIDSLIADARRDLIATDTSSVDDATLRLYELLDHTTTSRDAIYPDNHHLTSLLPLVSSFPSSDYRDGVLFDLGDIYIVDVDVLLSWLDISLYPPSPAFPDDTAPHQRALLFTSPHNGVAVLGVVLSTLVTVQ